MNSHDRLVLNWQEAYAAGPQIVGGKAWNLGRLARYGFTVPPDVALIAVAYEKFIEQNNLRDLIKRIAVEVSLESLAGGAPEALHLLRERIVAGTMPPAVVQAVTETLREAGLLERPLAVRSSATCEDSAEASFAGIHDSFLNVCGVSGIIAAIQKCYASLWSERAVAYRRKLGAPRMADGFNLAMYWWPRPPTRPGHRSF
jgi:pyruvate,water dikinase